tara:strand:+ start:181 stop:2400 length:2220 start_codon:yes stop_codon:yes gene_type:complete
MSLINPQPPLPSNEDVPAGSSVIGSKDEQWLNLARNAYDSSTDWVDTNLRYQWEKNLSNFNSVHPPGSKYLTSSYDKRSKLFRPKTRTVVRKLEAAMATAFFTNEDMMTVSPANPNDPMQMAGAAVAQSIMQYRLTNTIPWFSTMVTALQDAAIYGTVVSHQYWEFEEKDETFASVDDEGAEIVDMQGQQVRENVTSTIKDYPVIEVVEPENFRIDPASDWYDPISSSPYIIHLIPMFVQDVMERMDNKEWEKLSMGQLLSTQTQDDDTLRLTREEPREDPLEDQFETVDEFKIVWVHKNIIKKDGEDWCFFTAGTQYLLTKPKLLEEMYPWLKDGERPYVMGKLNIEAHRVYPSATVELTEELQAASNDIWNQRFDNIRLAMNKRYHIRRDRNIDLDALFRSVPGGAVEMDDPDQDVRVVETRDVTGSAYQEQDRINMDFDELQGNFSASTVGGARNLNETVGGMELIAGNTNTISEFVLRTFAETWVEPVLKQLLKLEQYYETDEHVTALSGEQGGVEGEEGVIRFGQDEILDELLKQDVLLKVNVGMNATDPVGRVQNLLYGVGSLAQFPSMEGRFNIDEIAKEVFAQLGYKDGSRFLMPSDGEDPQMAELQSQIEQMSKMIETDQVKMQGRLTIEQLKQEAALRAAQLKAQTELQKQVMSSQKDVGGLDIKTREAYIKQQDADTRRAELMLQRDALLNQIVDQEVQRRMVEGKNDVSKTGTMARDKYNKVPYGIG